MVNKNIIFNSLENKNKRRLKIQKFQKVFMKKKTKKNMKTIIQNLMIPLLIQVMIQLKIISPSIV